MTIHHFGLGLLLSLGGTAALADVLVVRSVGPSAKLFPPGKSLPADGRITLKPSDMIVVLDGRGTRTIRGPGTFSPAAPAQAMRTASAAPQRRARIGAVRGTGTNSSEARPATLWHVDVTKSSNICLVGKENATLWRPYATKPVTLTIQPKGSAAHKVQWPAGEATLGWPSQLGISDGTDYSLSWDGAARPTRIKFKLLPANPGGLEDTAALLIRNGCNAQLDLLIETVRIPEDRAPVG